MAVREVVDVQVVALAGAVGGRVVVAEDGQLLASPDGDLGEVGHEVVGDALRVLSDQPRRVGSGRVEVAQERDPPAWVGLDDVGQDALDHHLRLPIRADRGQRFVVLLVRHRGVLPVDGGRRREHQVGDLVTRHGPDEREGAVDVVLVVLQRLGRALADGLQRREMDDGVDVARGEHPVKTLAVAQVEIDRGNGGSGDLLEPVDDGAVAVDEVVDDHDVVPRRHERDDGVGPDVPRPAGDENAHVTLLELMAFLTRRACQSASTATGEGLV